jgi:adenylylsulfate kinase-like enzyme
MFVIAVDGRSGSGKTSLAARLRSALHAPVVTLEDLYGGWDGLERGIDLLVSEVLEPLAAGRGKTG